MTSEPNKIDQSYLDQLTSFEGRLKHTMDDESILQDVHRAIRELLKENRSGESDIRQILLDRFQSGTLREESFRLVQHMLDRVITEHVATLSDATQGSSPHEPALSGTDVMPPSTPVSDLPEEHLQIGSVLRDRFLLQQRISGGSMGVVYKALDRRLAEADDGDHSVAIKVLSPKLSRNGNALRALQQEAAKGRCLTHPNIVRFIDLDREGELYFIVMEWLEGRSLADILDNPDRKTIDVNTAMDIVMQIGGALDYAHRCGVIHADVKPGNIIITPEGLVKLFDFGVARIRQKQSKVLSKFDPSVLGAKTPAYSSMQVLTGDEPVASDDVYSLACLLYRLIAGYRVFGPRNAAEAAESGMEPQRPQGLDDLQWKALKKALAFSRVARYSSVKEFTGDLPVMTEKSEVSAMAEKTEVPVITEKSEVSAEARVNMPAKVPAQVSVETSAKVPVEVPVEVPVNVSVEAPVEVSLEDVNIHRFSEPDKSRWPLVLGIALIAGLAYLGVTTDLISRYLPLVIPDSNSGSVVTATTDKRVPETTSPPVGAVDETPAESDPIADTEPTAAAPTVVDANIVEDNVEQAFTDDSLDESGDLEVTLPAGEIAAKTEADKTEEVQFAADYSDVFAEFPGEVEAAVQETSPEVRSRPQATHSLTIGGPGAAIEEINITLREGQDAAVIDILRSGDPGRPLTLRIAEVGFSGNFSPWSTGEYDVADNGIVEFSTNQVVAQTTIVMAPDSINEPDQQANLMVRALDSPSSKLAVINLVLEDADRREFEARLPSNTVAFSSRQVTVRENDPVVQIDVARFNSDGQALDVNYSVRGITATDGEDYFSPDITTVSFAPNQSSVRLLIPLVQDSVDEIDETFVLEIDPGMTRNEPNINSQITVMIKDDDFGTN